MFESLSKRLGDIFDRLKRRGALSEDDVAAVAREIRIALLEADVALPVVKEFIESIKQRAVGQEVIKSVTPAQMVVKIVHDHLIEILGSQESNLNLNSTPPVVIMMAGLQGSGKTTTTGKLAHFLTNKYRKKVLMASTDIYRPAAREQLEVLGQQTKITTLPIKEKEKPLAIAKRAHEMARLEGYDVLLLDTAGRLHIDEELMDELADIKKALKPTEILLVADAMTGQDAVNIAKSFHEKLDLTGIILTRVDGDARGGAALSMRQVTGCPIKFVGLGERVEQFDIFYPDRIASRILDMGDVVTLVEKAAETIDREEAEKLAKKVEKGSFDLDDFASQIKQISKMGGMSGIMNLLPGMGKFKDKIEEAGIDDNLIKRQLAIIHSMTLKERKFYKILNASRRKRIAQGSGTTVQDVNRLLKQYQDMLNVMKRFKKIGKKGFLRQGLKGLFSPK
ncbi:signal recognition particle protein [Candidatus Nucleicultrix amoebiphila]|uniref:Signal recognition particle protein n=1 Tax=Candidatus Nucleicultrix amoebiphila FS5 TaxID=1414854 RepID=A0A1W6N3T6_9PROT|nr:signal recognition particle protein [Candidatus Nucleicultrix amoebiphila]ARN84431.1 RNA-binding protein [Candidatus Nucleicultrix amoebiphila FS5]